jgi:outer membrane protein, adhesin transport system
LKTRRNPALTRSYKLKSLVQSFLQLKPCILLLMWMASTTCVYAQSLQQMIRQSLQTHPSVRAQQLQLFAAGNEVEAAKQQFFPIPSVSLERVNRAASDTQYLGDSMATVFRLQQPLWTGGRLTAGVDKARANESLVQASLDDSRYQLAMRVLTAWGDWYTASERIKAHDASYKTHQRLLAQVERRVKEGASAESELTLTRGRLAQTSALLASAQVQSQSAQAKLTTLTGGAVLPEAAAQEHLRFPPDDLRQHLSHALESSPTLQKIRYQLQMMEADIAEKKSSFHPEVSLRAEHQRGNFSYSNAPNVNRVFISLTSKLGAGTSNWDFLQAAEQKKQAMDSEVRTQQLAITEQIESDWLQLRSVEQRQAALKESLIAARYTVESWDRQFLAGRKSWQEVLNAARELLQAEIEMSDAVVSESVLKWRLTIASRGVDAALSLSTP